MLVVRLVECASRGTASEPARLLVGAPRIPHVLLCSENSLSFVRRFVHQWGRDLLTDPLRVLLSGCRDLA